MKGGGEGRIESLETARTVHTLASDIIAFLAHLEEFQKRLWLKKKFVLSTHYCITLDRVPEKFYPEIAANTPQRNAWKHLFSIEEINGNLIGADYAEPLTGEFLKQHPNLVLDTGHFPTAFKDLLLSHFDNLDAETDGLLIHGENFQALNLLTAKYRESLKAIYIDPPYNTDASAILYKNNYKDSSWMSLMADRISVSRELLAADGIFCAAINDVEAANLRHLLQDLFGKANELGIVVVCANPAGLQKPTSFASCHEYAMFFSLIEGTRIGRLNRTEKQEKSFNQRDDQGRRFQWKSIKGGGGPNAFRAARPRLFYPLFVKGNTVRIPNMEWDDARLQWKCLESPAPGETKIHPTRPKTGEEMTWKYGVETLEGMLPELSANTTSRGTITIRVKNYPNEEGVLPNTWWGKKEYSSADAAENKNGDEGATQYSSSTHGTVFLTNMLGDSLAFPFPKSIHLVEDCLRVSSLGKEDIVLDYFGGSGTTAHATINLNRQDGGKRKYILVEMGHHFDTVLKPRVLKAIYAEQWKEGKPVSRESRLSQIIKYQRIESYEDALNNIAFAETDDAQLHFDEHRLSYMFDRETRDSPTFLNVKELQSPFSYQLKIIDGLTVKTQEVDLPETFNYLLGMSVKTRQCLKDSDRDYLIYRGVIGSKDVIIIWRETAGWHPSDYERDYRFIQDHALTESVDEIYINTHSIIPEAKVLDALFKRLMFQ